MVPWLSEEGGKRLQKSDFYEYQLCVGVSIKYKIKNKKNFNPRKMHIVEFDIIIKAPIWCSVYPPIEAII